MQTELLAAMNAERARSGLSQLGTHSTLQKAAQGHADWMAVNSRMSHTGQGGSSFSERIHAAGPYPIVAMAENVAWGQDSPAECVSSWMNSSGHRRAILNSTYKSAGCGAATGRDGIYWCAVFGAAEPDNQTPPPDPLPPPQPKLTWWQRFLSLLGW